LQGHLIPSGLGSTFTSTFSNPTTGTGSPTSPVTLDQYTYPTGGSTNYPGKLSISGTGSTNFQIAVDSYNSNYFLNPPTIIGLSFNPISLSLPFGQEPAAALVQGVAPNIGSVNGGPLPGTGGPDLLVQTQATNNFTVPEPSSVSMAVTGIGLVSLARLWARRRRRSALLRGAPGKELQSSD
jgi:MYXO-CTERM domain-containing protein